MFLFSLNTLTDFLICGTIKVQQVKTLYPVMKGGKSMNKLILIAFAEGGGKGTGKKKKTETPKNETTTQTKKVKVQRKSTSGFVNKTTQR